MLQGFFWRRKRIIYWWRIVGMAEIYKENKSSEGNCIFTFLYKYHTILYLLYTYSKQEL